MVAETVREKYDWPVWTSLGAVSGIAAGVGWVYFANGYADESMATSLQEHWPLFASRVLLSFGYASFWLPVLRAGERRVKRELAEYPVTGVAQTSARFSVNLSGNGAYTLLEYVVLSAAGATAPGLSVAPTMVLSLLSTTALFESDARGFKLEAIARDAYDKVRPRLSNASFAVAELGRSVGF